MAWRVLKFSNVGKTLLQISFLAPILTSTLNICFHDYWNNIYYRWQMDNLSTFLELPLDRDLYKPKQTLKCEKPALRILITEAGTKVAQLLMYKLCSGEVFGPNQPVIIHLVNAKGCINHKSTLLDLQECGFPALEESVVSAEPQESYKNVDIVALIAPCEALSGYSLYHSFLSQLIKVRNVARNVRIYGKPDTKIVVCCPSTKGAVVLLTCIRIFEPRINAKNITCVVFLDETIAKNMIAAQFKTTTDNIKNVTIWGRVTADLRNATVRMYPPEDKSNLEKMDIPVLEALENQKWIYSDFLPGIFSRALGSELMKHGAALASAIAKHLKVLIQGSDSHDEIISMGVIVPQNEPFGFKKDIGFSLPVLINNGSVKIREDVEYDVSTHLMNLRAVYDVENNTSMKEIYNMVNLILNYEKTTGRKFIWSEYSYFVDECQMNNFLTSFMSPVPEDPSAPEGRDINTKKSIGWNEGVTRDDKKPRSILRFNI